MTTGTLLSRTQEHWQSTLLMSPHRKHCTSDWCIFLIPFHSNLNFQFIFPVSISSLCFYFPFPVSSCRFIFIFCFRYAHLDLTDTPNYHVLSAVKDTLIRLVTNFGPSCHLILFGVGWGGILYMWWLNHQTYQVALLYTYVYKMFSSLQLPSIALMEHFVWLMDPWRVLAEWKFASMECGEECVVVTWVAMMPESCADNWDMMSTQVSSFGKKS